jgi:hypothetical protein
MPLRRDDRERLRELAMRTYSATTVIDASAERVWQILTDAQGYPRWDPWAIKIEGSIGQGTQIIVYTRLSPNRALPMRVEEWVPTRLMTWVWGMPFGLFNGVRRFALNPRHESQVEFSISETISGPLSLVLAGSFPDLTRPFHDLAVGLKARVEEY